MVSQLNTLHVVSFSITSPRINFTCNVYSRIIIIIIIIHQAKKISYVLSNVVSVQPFCHRPYNNFTVRRRIEKFNGNKGRSEENFEDTVKLADTENYQDKIQQRLNRNGN